MNEVGSGLLIQDVLQGVPVNVSASLIMQLVGRLIDLFSAVNVSDAVLSCLGSG